MRFNGIPLNDATEAQVYLFAFLRVMKFLGLLNRVLDSTPWGDFGRSREDFNKWLAQQEADELTRMEAMRVAAEQEMLRATALTKLTVAEIKALGLS